MKLNLGSGTARHRAGFVNVDANPALKPDLVATLPPIPAPDGSCEELLASHFLEHLTRDDANRLMAEAWRVLVPGGTFEIVVPYALSHGAFQDPTHRSFWVPESFDYYTARWRHLGYDLESRFELVSRELRQETNEVHAVLRKVLA